MTEQAPESKGKRLPIGERIAVYQKKLQALKERSALREIMERELLMEFLSVNHSGINEYPLLDAQQRSVVEILCGRSGHPGYEYIHKHIANFILLLVHHEKAVKVRDKDKAEELQSRITNTESILIKCAQGIVYAMALITDNFEEVVLRYFGKQAMGQYSSLIEKHRLNENFWKAFIEHFVTSRVDEAHKEILEGEKYSLSKERNFLVIRFLFDDILSKLNPTDQTIEKTRIQSKYLASTEDAAVAKRAKLSQSILIRGMGELTQAKKISKNEYIHSARIVCMDQVAADFETLYAESRARQNEPDERDAETFRADQIKMAFTMDQVVAVGMGAAIAIGLTSTQFYKALEAFIPDKIETIRPLAGDFTIPTLERILYFLLENHFIHILTEVGRSEGSKIQVRSGRARRVSSEDADALHGMTKIRKKQLFGNDVTREGSLLFKAKTLKQLQDGMAMLSLEAELQKGLLTLWKNAVFRVDIMVLINLELVARTTTNLKTKLAEILKSYGVAKGV